MTQCLETSCLSLKRLIDYTPLADQGIGRSIAVFWRASYRVIQDVDALVQTICEHLPEDVQALG